MIGLRVAHVLGPAHVSAAASSALNLMRWLEQHGHDSVLITSGGPIADDSRGEGYELIEFQAGSGPRWWLKKRGELMRRIADWQPDLLHVHRVDQLSLGLAISRKLHLPVVVSVHRPLTSGAAKDLRQPEVAIILVPSDAQRAHYAGRLGLDRDRVAVLPYGVDMAAFAPERPASPGAPLCIGAIGNFDDNTSGFADLIDALARLRDAGGEFRGLLVGSGRGRQQLEARVEERELGELVQFADSSTRTAPLLERMDVFVYPVRQDAHYLGVIKAMAASCAVVATAVCGIPELIKDGEAGLLVPPGDVETLADTLSGLLKQPERARELGRRARVLVEQQHDLARMGDIAHELYRAALRGTGGSGGTETVTTHRRHSGLASIQDPEHRELP